VKVGMRMGRRGLTSLVLITGDDGEARKDIEI
jgi:hypothetical protein